MKFKRILGKVGKFAGRAALHRVGLTEQGGHFVLSEELQEQLVDVIGTGVLEALLEYDRLAARKASDEEKSS